jgi:hypothetical protein
MLEVIGYISARNVVKVVKVNTLLSFRLADIELPTSDTKK